MRVLKIGAVLATMVVAGVLSVSSAAAAPVTTSSYWYVNGSKLANGSSNILDCAKTGSANFVIETTILVPVELTASGINCGLGTAKIVQSGSAAKAESTLQFTGVTVMTPSGCTTPTTITTSALTSELYMDSATAAVIYDKFEATSGGSFMTLKLENCSIAGTYPVKGALFGQWANTTGVSSNPQRVVFNSTTAGFSTLAVGSTAALVTGEMNKTVTNPSITSVPFSAKDS
jgi:hypothetical protein